MNIKDLNSLFGGVYLPAALTRCSFLSAFAKLLFAHLAQMADSHNLVQLNFLFSVSELGFLDECELIETLDELESFGLILVQRGNSNSELVIVRLMPDFTEILANREAERRRKKRARHSAAFNVSRSRAADPADRAQSGKADIYNITDYKESNSKKSVVESVENAQCEFFSPVGRENQFSTTRRKVNRKEPRSRHSLQDCWSFAQYQRQINGAERIPTPDRFAVALYTTGQQDDEIDLFLLSREQYQETGSDISAMH